MRITLLISLLFIALSSNAQHPAFYFFGEDQFRGVDIYDVIQDDNHNYFFATDQGVFLHDGYTYQKISCTDMKGASAFGFVKDRKGVLYCHNLHHQVFRITESKMELYYEIPLDMQRNDISLVVDHKNNLIIQSLGLTIIPSEYKDVKQVKKFNIKGGVGPSNVQLLPNGSTISFVKQNELVLQENGKLTYLESKILKDLLGNLQTDSFIWFEIGDKTYAIDRDKMNVFKFDPDSFKFKHIKALNVKLSKQSIRVSVVNDQIWIAGNANGVFIYDREFNPLYNGNRIYANHFISDVYTDHENNTLLSTFDEGIMIVPNNHVQGMFLPGEAKITQMESGDNQSIFIGTSQGHIYNYENGQLKLIYSDPVSMAVERLIYWKERKTLTFTTHNGVQFSRWDGSKLHHEHSYNSSYKNAHYFNDHSGLIAFNNGIRNLNISNNQEFSLDRILALSERAYSIVKDLKTNTVYAGMSNGLCTLSEDGKKKPVKYKGEVVYPNALLYQGGKVIIGTRKHGILIYSNDKLVSHIPFEKRIRKILIHKDRMYVMSYSSLHVGNADGTKLKRINKSTGLSCENISEFLVANDKLYITNSESIQSISLADLIGTPKIIPISFSQILVNDEISQSTFLTHDQGKLEFKFKVSTIRFRDNIKYRYKLIGYESEWQELEYDQINVVYNALPPGDYTFIVESINDQSVSQPISYSFTIDSPFHQKWMFYFLIILVSGLAIGLIFMYRIRKIRKKNKERLEKQKIQTDLLETELRALRSQMNPHFIFNALNSIQDLILKEDTDASYDYIVLFADLVRSALNYSNKDFIPIEKELEFLNVYLSLEKLRFKEEFNYTIDYNGEEDIDVPSMLIQPFIENALLHGLLHKSGAKELTISFEYTDKLICTIEDNGIGRKKSAEIAVRQGKEHESFALEAINKRLSIFNARQGEEIGHYLIEDIHPEEEETGTRVIIYLPFKRHF